MAIEEQDDLLREGLACYTARDPWPGIEQRVLRRVRSPRIVARSGWALVLMAAACVIVMTMIPRQEALEISAPQIAAPLPIVVKAEAPRALQKPERFPTPSPLTREEKMLLAVAETNAFAESSDTAITPIQIDEITIAPIGD